MFGRAERHVPPDPGGELGPAERRSSIRPGQIPGVRFGRVPLAEVDPAEREPRGSGRDRSPVVRGEAVFEPERPRPVRERPFDRAGVPRGQVRHDGVDRPDRAVGVARPADHLVERFGADDVAAEERADDSRVRNRGRRSGRERVEVLFVTCEERALPVLEERLGPFPFLADGFVRSGLDQQRRPPRTDQHVRRSGAGHRRREVERRGAEPRAEDEDGAPGQPAGEPLEADEFVVPLVGTPQQRCAGLGRELPVRVVAAEQPVGDGAMHATERDRIVPDGEVLLVVRVAVREGRPVVGAVRQRQRDVAVGRVAGEPQHDGRRRHGEASERL